MSTTASLPAAAPPQGPRSLSQTPPAWQKAQRDAITDPAELIRLLALPAGMLPAARRAAALFGLRVPRGYAARMRRGDPDDPLLRQVLPLDAEHDDVPGFSADAVGDLGSLSGDGVLHKYHGRALLVTTGACAVHCRYCFRRHFPYADANAARGAWRGALDRIAADTSLTEIILSGGDPLSLSDRRLGELATALDAIPHLRRLRIHTRHPVVLPERIDDAFLDWFGRGRLRRVVVIHANHPRELDATVAAALARLRDAGAVLLNQAVLLRGVNDDESVLAELGERLFECGVMPYYLHLLDRTAGTAHFEVPPAEARRLWQSLAARTPGYLLPRLAREIPGEPSKTLIGFQRTDTTHG
ncbi:Lysine 2,3-aminomutase [Salinisphaera sp. PC39]|uniref:EF-P beta-lysylation protein EpmB n=1 Tax=Salinisphaera sp. PC39 TaxID=1304156 RepID=UPI003342CE30